MALLEQHFYHGTISLYTSVFGNLFNDIKILRKDNKLIKVPIAYAAQQKYNTRLDQDEDPNLVRFMKRTPRMSFQLAGLPQRDITRAKSKHNKLTNFHVEDRTLPNADIKNQYNRVPYLFPYTLNVTTKYLDDLLQIVEQISVTFNPAIQVVVKDNPDLSDESALTITLNDSSADDSFEGIYETGREITATFNFTLEGYLYMPTSGASVIKTIYLNYYDMKEPPTFLETDIVDEDDL